MIMIMIMISCLGIQSPLGTVPSNLQRNFFPVHSYFFQGSQWASQLLLLNCFPLSPSQFLPSIWGKLPLKYPSQSYTCVFWIYCVLVNSSFLRMLKLNVLVSASVPQHGTKGDANFSDKLGQGQQLSLGAGLEQGFLSHLFQSGFRARGD